MLSVQMDTCSLSTARLRRSLARERVPHREYCGKEMERVSLHRTVRRSRRERYTCDFGFQDRRNISGSSRWLPRAMGKAVGMVGPNSSKGCSTSLPTTREGSVACVARQPDRLHDSLVVQRSGEAIDPGTPGSRSLPRCRECRRSQPHLSFTVLHSSRASVTAGARTSRPVTGTSSHTRCVSTGGSSNSSVEAPAKTPPLSSRSNPVLPPMLR